jgi:hypothetical protein
MKKSNTEKPFSSEIKIDRKNRRYNYKFIRINKNHKKFLESSPEKECSSINEIVKRSVEKINNLFQQQNINETDEKNINLNVNPLFINNRVKYRENQNFHTVNTKEDISNYNIRNKNEGSKNEDDLSENINQNISSCMIVDVNALKRNVKQHTLDFKKLSKLFKSKKDTKNQIDYIQKSNQNEKKYIIQNIDNYQTLFNQKTKINLQNSQNDCYSPVKTKKNYLFQSEIIKDLSNGQYLLDNNLKTNQENRRNKYFSFYLNKNSKKNGSRNNRKINNLKAKIENNKINNSIRKQNSNRYFESIYNRTKSAYNNKENKNKKYNNLRKNKTNNSIKNYTKFFSNTKIQNISQIKIYASSYSFKTKKEKYRSKTQSHFNNVNSTQILKQFYSKEFPSKIKTNDILKLMLFLNEYIINNNLLDDYYMEKNRKILDDYTKFLITKINFNTYPKETELVNDDLVNRTNIIQRNWRKIKIEKFLEKKKLTEEYELKKMVMNNYIEKAGYQTKKFFGIFHNLIEQFTFMEEKNNVNTKENNLNKSFYLVNKIMKNNLTNCEKNKLYKDYINKVIFLY